MPKSTKEEKYRWIRPILDKEISIKNMARVCHYLIDPGKPAQNGKVERSHRTDQEMFYERNVFKSRKELETKLRMWNNEYNDMEYCGLNGLSPNEYLRLSGVQNIYV